MTRVMAIGLVVSFAGILVAQNPPAIPIVEPQAPSEQWALPAGQSVSRPLTVVQVPLEPPAPLPTVKPPIEEKTKVAPVLPQMWDSWELLLWWTKAQPLPNLVIGYRPPFTPSSASVLIGGEGLASGLDGGGRFVVGRSLGDKSALGIEASYLFLGGQMGRRNTADNTPRWPMISRPFYSTGTGNVDVLVANTNPGILGGVDVATSTRLSSWEVNAVGALWTGERASLSIHAGYRYFRLKEGLRIEQVGAYNINTGYAVGLSDQFDTANSFNGGQFGFRGEVGRGPVFVEFHGAVALGQNYQTVNIAGQTNVTGPNGTSALAPGGLLALNSNIGTWTASTFTVLPEARIKLGVKAGDNTRFTIGYNLIYLNNAVRPGSQIDRVINPTQIPVFNPAAFAGNATYAERPGVPFQRGDFWAQGLTFTWESKY